MPSLSEERFAMSRDDSSATSPEVASLETAWASRGLGLDGTCVPLPIIRDEKIEVMNR